MPIQDEPPKDKPHPPVPADLRVGDVSTLPAGSDATAQIRRTDEGGYVIDLGIPRGDAGQSGGVGDPGADAELDIEAVAAGVVDRLPPITITLMDDMNGDGVYTDASGRVIAAKSAVAGDPRSEGVSRRM